MLLIQRRFLIAPLAFLAYLAGARIGDAMALRDGVVAIWPPSGITLGLLLVWPRRDWPAILGGAFAGSLASDLVSHHVLAFAVAAAFANTLETFAAGWFVSLRSAPPGQASGLTTLRAALEFFWRAPVISNAVTALVGAAVLNRWAHLPVRSAWFVWWAGHGLGMLILTPVIIAWRGWRSTLRTPRPWVVVEAIALVLSILTVAQLTLSGHLAGFRPGPYIMFPVLFWAALRFGARGAATAVLLVAALALWYTAHGTGPFMSVGITTIQVATMLSIYLAVASLSSLLSSSVIEERKQSSTRYRSVVDAATDVVITIDEDSRIEFVNAAIQGVFGYSPAEVVGKDLTMLMPATVRPHHRAGLARYLATGSRNIPWQGVALPGLHRDGREIPLEISFGEMSVAGRQLFTGIIRDMTEKRALEEQYRQSQKMEALGQLAGGIAHDFNNLLTAIHGYSTMVMETLPPDSTARDDVSEILNATKRAESLTRQLLVFSRRQIIAPRIIDLAAIVRQIEPMLRRVIGEHIELVVQAPALPPQLVRADPGQIEQVVINLAVNARDAMQNGGVLHITVGREPPSRAVMTVRDTGSGMSGETRERLFEPFYTTKAVGKGTGLGLATVHGIVKQSGGSIEVETEPGAGTTFRIVLPRFVGSPESGSSVRVIAQRSRSETILVAEDDAALRQLVNRVLGKQGYRVLLAGTPTEALEVEASHPDRIHLLLTDVVMPGMNGRALANEIVSRRQDIRVMYMSGYTDDEAMKRDVLERNARFIQKPFDPEALRQMVAEALDDPRDGP